ncbi:fap1 adhesin-like [Salvelinus alpinus]|uniref:fap1 adhesin-like n=1 Tax=Salvelinus alpinus TaxID=8036 RepID=UPI0039FB99EC
MVQLQEEGHIPKDVTLEDMIEYLLNKGAQNLKHLQSTIGSRDRGQKYGLQTALYDQEREFKEDWVSKERSRLKLIEKDVRHDLNKAKYMKEAKEKRIRKKMCIMEQKQAIQLRIMEEELKNLQEFERLREASIKPNKLLEEIFEKPASAQPALKPAQSKTVKKTVSLSGKSKEKPAMLQRRPSLAPLQRRPCLDGLAPLKGFQEPVFRIFKAIKGQSIPDRAQLKSVILDHLGSKLVRKQLAESIRDEVKLTIPGSTPAAQRALSARIAYDVLKCVSRAANPSNEPACRLRGGNTIKPNAQADDPEPEERMANGEDINAYVTTLITDVLEEVQEQVIVMIREDSPTQFRVVSAKASQTAIDVVSNVLEDIRHLLNEENIEELALDCDAEEGTSGITNIQPPALTALKKADPENRRDSCSKLEGVACDLISTAYDSILFELAFPELQGERDEQPINSRAIRSDIQISFVVKAPSLTLEILPSEPVISSLSNSPSYGMVFSSDTSEAAENNSKTSSSEASAAASTSSQETDTTTTVECKEERVENGNTSETDNVLSVPSVNTEEVVSKPILLHKVKKENAATRSASLPNLYGLVVDAVMDHFSTEPFKDNLAQSVKNEVRRTLSMPECGLLNLQIDNYFERKMLEDMLKEVSRQCGGTSSSTVAEEATDEEEIYRLESAAAQLIQKVFQEVKTNFVVKIKKGSPKRCLSPEVSRTAINAVSSLLGDMETTVMASVPCSCTTSRADMEGMLSEATGEHPAKSMASAKVELIADDLVEDAIDMCSKMILDDQPLALLHDDPEEGTSNVVVPGPIQSSLSGSDERHTKSQVPAVKIEDHEVKPILIQDTALISPGEKNTDEKRVIRVSYVFNSSPRRKAHQATRSTSFPNLYVTLVDGVLHQISTEPFKETLAQSVRNEVRHSVSLPQFGSVNLKSEDCSEKEIIEDMLKSVSRKLSKDQACQLTGKASETMNANVDAISLTAKDQIIKVLEQVNTKIINMIRQDSPNRTISPKASQTAINAVSNILGAMGTSLKASNTPFVPNVAGLQPDLDDVASYSTEAFEGYPGTWMSSLKIKYIASGLMDTVCDDLLDEDGFLRRSAGAISSQEDLDLQKVITSKPASPVNCMPVKGCLSMSYLDALKNPEDIENATHLSRSIDSLSVIGVPTSTSKEVSYGTELKLTQLQKDVSASSSLYAMSNCRSSLEFPSSRSDIPIDKEAQRISSTDEEDSLSKSLLTSSKSVFNVSGLVPTPPEGKPKVRLPDIENATHLSRSIDSLSVIGVPTSTSKEVSYGTELKLTQLQKDVSASSSLYAMSNCRSSLEFPSSRSDIPIDKEAQRISSTDEEDSLSKSLLTSSKSVFNVSGLVPTPPEGKPKVRLPRRPVLRLRKVPEEPPKKMHIYKVCRGAFHFPTETMRLTSPSSFEGEFSTPESQRPR